MSQLKYIHSGFITSCRLQKERGQFWAFHLVLSGGWTHWSAYQSHPAASLARGRHFNFHSQKKSTVYIPSSINNVQRRGHSWRLKGGVSLQQSDFQTAHQWALWQLVSLCIDLSKHLVFSSLSLGKRQIMFARARRPWVWRENKYLTSLSTLH